MVDLWCLVGGNRLDNLWRVCCLAVWSLDIVLIFRSSRAELRITAQFSVVKLLGSWKVVVVFDIRNSNVITWFVEGNLSSGFFTVRAKI